MTHHLNQLLGTAVYSHDLNEDEQTSTAEVLNSLKQLQDKVLVPGFIMTNKEIGRISRQLSVHSTMKYPFTDEMVEVGLNLFMQVYYNPGLTTGMKSKVLRTMQLLCRKVKHRDGIKFSFNYQPLWEEAIRMLSRLDRLDCTTSETIFADLLQQIPEFLHNARRFVAFDNDSVKAVGSSSSSSICTSAETPAEDRDAMMDRMMDKAMSMLADVHFPACSEGLLLLIDCLSNDYKKYDQMLPQWMAKWAQISHNPHWDCCWLTLLARARKHCPTAATSIPWKQYTPFLFAKAKELLSLPLVNGSKHVGCAAWPFSFKYHAKLLTIPYDVRQMTLKKLAKVLHYACLAVPDSDGNALVPAVPSSITSPSIAFAPADEMLAEEDPQIPYPASTADVQVLSGGVEIAMFLQSIRMFFYPAAQGSWSQLLAFFQASLVMQLCRHVGHRIANAIVHNGELKPLNADLLLLLESTVSDNSTEDRRKTANFLPPLHVPTVQYLLRELYLPIALEQLYAKNPMLSSCAVSCLKNIISVEPCLGHRVLRFVLSALDPAAISQPHQTPIAMRTISTCFHPLLYPNPVVIKYLYKILKLSLDGVDASDNNKTLVTLDMFSTILAWIPLLSAVPSTTAATASAVAPVPSFLAIAAVDSSSVTRVKGATAQQLVTALPDELQQYIAEEWAPSLLDRVFAVLEAQEAPKENTNKSPIPAAVGQCLTYLFQSVASHQHCDAGSPRSTLRAALQQKVMRYFESNTPINAAKASAKIYEAMVSADPTLLARALPPLLEDDVRYLKCSHEKVAFRLRLAGGACRGALGKNIFKDGLCDQYVLSIISNKDFYNHSEKGVKEATRKLLKDVLKGASSFYPIDVQPIYDAGISTVLPPLGAPNVSYSSKLRFHVPTKSDLAATICLLQSTAVQVMDAASLQVTALSDPAAGTSTADAKKEEELLISRMWMLERCLRGAAEILGDVTAVSDSAAAAMDVDEDEENECNAADSLDAKSKKLIVTGRETLLAAMDEKDRIFLEGLRVRVLEFLFLIQDKLSQSSASSETFISATADATTDEAAATTGASAAAGEGGDSGSSGNIFNSQSFQHVWLQCLNLVIARRMPWLKDIDNIKKVMKMSTKNARTSITNVVYKSVKKLNSGWEATSDVSALNYWHYHDTSTITIACNVWMQHGIRVKELSYAAVKKHVNTRAKHTDPFMKCLLQVVELCQHEFDKIRAMTIKAFDLITSRFSIMKLTGLVKDVMAVLQRPSQQLSFPKAHGALCLLEHSRIMGRIISDVVLSEQLLGSLMHAERTLLIDDVTAEQDKRKRLADRITEALLKYTKKWDAPPYCTLTSPRQLTASRQLLELTMSRAGSSSSSVSSELVDAEGSANQAVGGGLRFQTFAAFFVLHQLGRDASALTTTNGDAPAQLHQSKGTWEWVLNGLCNNQNLPVQTIALTALSRVVFSFSPQQPMEQETLSYLQSKLSPKSTTSQWAALIKGIAQTYPQNSEDGSSAQWSRGIKPVLLSARFLKIAFPRHALSLQMKHDRFLNDLYKENACIFLQLARVGAMDSATDGSVLDPANLTIIFDLCKSVTSTAANESEIRCINFLKSELYAALLRHYRTDAAINALDTNSERIAALQRVFVSLLQSACDDLSTDYFTTWEDAIHFAFECDPVQTTAVDALMLSYITNGLKLAVTRRQQPSSVASVAAAAVVSDTAETTAATSSDESSKQLQSADAAAEGFAGQMKAINIASSLFTADYSACYLLSCEQGTRSDTTKVMPVTFSALLDIFLLPDTSLTSPFRTVRSSIASLMCDLMEVSARNNPAAVWKDHVQQLCNKLISEATSIRESDSNSSINDQQQSTSSSESAVLDNDSLSRQVCESVCLLLDSFMRASTMWILVDVLEPLIETIVAGSGKFVTSDVALSKLCHDVAVSVANVSTRTLVGTSSYPTYLADVPATPDMLLHMLAVCQNVIGSAANNADSTTATAVASLHARETVMKMLTVIMVNKWNMLKSEQERKVMKDVFAKGISDPKPEIQLLAQAGMVAYLSFKQPSELATIAAVYTKNSEVYATREKKRKRLAKSAESGDATTGTADTAAAKLDPAHGNTVYMMACVILCTPYDLPAYLPPLLASFVRHISVSSLRDVIIRTVQMFKRTHQDRWEEDFKQQFTSDQLAELQGTGAAHYYS